MKMNPHNDIERLLEQSATSPLPQLPRRKEAMLRTLQRRIVSRHSPYARFLPFVIPAMLVIILVFWAGGERSRLPGDIVAYLDTTNTAISALSPEEYETVRNATGIDPAEIITSIRGARNVSFVEGDSLRSGESVMLSQKSDESMMVAPRDTSYPAPSVRTAAPQAFSVSEEDVESDSYDSSSVTATGLGGGTPLVPILPPVTFIVFTDDDGVFLVGFDGRGVPISFTPMPETEIHF